MAMTLRLPAALSERARRYADQLGISLNALLAVALRDYLDARAEPSPRTVRRTVPGPAPASGVRALAQAIAQQVKAGPVKRRT